MLGALIIVTTRIGKRIAIQEIWPNPEECISRDVARSFDAILVVNGKYKVYGLKQLARSGAQALIRWIEICAVRIAVVCTVKAVDCKADPPKPTDVFFGAFALSAIFGISALALLLYMSFISARSLITLVDVRRAAEVTFLAVVGACKEVLPRLISLPVMT
jgi:hypothetical protein